MDRVFPRGANAAAVTSRSTPGLEPPASGFDLVATIDDDRAFRAWYERTAPRVYAYLLSRTGSPAQAEELLQRVFVEVIRRPAAFDGRADAIPWLIGIARHQLGRQYREQAQADRWWRGGRVREISPMTGPPESRATDLALDIRAALQSLPTLQRAALVFRFLDGLSVRDVADHLGRSQAATESLLRRGRRQFELAYRGGSDAD